MSSAQSAVETAGLRPDRAYFGLEKPVLLTVSLGAAKAAEPAGVAEAQPEPVAEIELVSIADHRMLAREPLRPKWAEPRANPGTTGARAAGLGVVKVDFAELFPGVWSGLWDGQENRGASALLAQLVIDGVRRGPPLVVQAVGEPVIATLTDRTGAPVFPSPGGPRVVSGVRVYVQKTLVVDTTLGEMEFALRPDEAPNTVWHIMQLVRDGFYTDMPVHRIASLTGGARPDIVQAGDPLGNGQGGPGFYMDMELSGLAHGFGVLSMARKSDPNTNGSQFFICLSREGTASLDGRYTSFGTLIRGGDVLRAVARTPAGPDQRPVDAPVIRRMWLEDASPVGEQGPPEIDPYAESPGR